MMEAVKRGASQNSVVSRRLEIDSAMADLEQRFIDAAQKDLGIAPSA
jgi:hypothetical protein